MTLTRRDLLYAAGLSLAGAACSRTLPRPAPAPPQPSVARFAPLITVRLVLAQPAAIVAGAFDGRLHGSVVAAASVWTPRELHLVLETDAGERVDVLAQRVGDGTVARFETAALGLGYLNRLLAVGTVAEHGAQQVHSLEMLL
jgi:hypothetical protein